VSLSLCQTEAEQVSVLDTVIPGQAVWVSQRTALGHLSLSNMLAVFRELSSLNRLVPVTPDFASSAPTKPDMARDTEGLGSYARLVIFTWKLATASSPKDFFLVRTGGGRSWLLHEILLARTYFLGCHLDLAETGAEDFLWSNQVPATVKMIEDFLKDTDSVVLRLLSGPSLSSADVGAITQNLLAAVEKLHEEDEVEDEEGSSVTSHGAATTSVQSIVLPELNLASEVFSLALDSSASFHKDLVGKATTSMTLCTVLGDLVKGLALPAANAELLVKALLVDHTCECLPALRTFLAFFLNRSLFSLQQILRQILLCPCLSAGLCPRSPPCLSPGCRHASRAS